MSSRIPELVAGNRIDPLLLAAASEDDSALQSIHAAGHNVDVDVAAEEDVHDAGGNVAYPTTARLHNIVSASANDVGGKKAAGTITVNDIDIVEATDQGTVTIVDWAKANGEKAVGRITVTNFAALAGDTITVDNTTITEGVDFDAEVSNEQTARNIAAALAGETAVAVSVNPGTAVVLIEAAAIGTAGNSIVVQTNGSGALTLSGATLAGGKAALSITVNGTARTAGTHFTAATSNAATATSLATAIAALAGVGATANGAVVTITDDTAGVVTSKALLTSNTSAATVSGATLAGGADTLTVEVNGVSLVAGTDFEPGATVEETATNLAAAINASEDVGLDGIVTAVAAGAVVTVTAVANGTAANSYTLAADTDSATASGATLSGGRADGTGARTVLVKGLDASYNQAEETVTLNGTSNVATTTAYVRIQEMRVVTAGSGGAAAGNITATAQTDATVSATIIAANNRTLGACRTVPAGFTGYVLGLTASQVSEASQAGTLKLLARRTGEVFVTEDVMGVHSDGEQSRRYATPLMFPEKTDIKLRAAAPDNTSFSAAFDLLLVKNAAA